MATRFKKPSKKTTIALAVAIVILLIIAVTGTVAFLKDRGRTEAADLETEQQGNLAQSGEENSNQPGEETLNPEQGENQEQIEGTDTQTGEQEGQTETTGTTGTNNQNAGTTTQVDNIQETTIERVETVEIAERKISEGHYVGWTPMELTAYIASSKLNVNDSKDIEISKQSFTNSGSKVVTRGETITYTISVKNISNDDMTDVEVKDRIPEMTTYVEKSADNSAAEIVEDENVIGLIWNLDLKAGEEKVVSFKVVVDETATGVITNIALANGEETEPVENTVIEATKTAIIEGKEVGATAKIGDKITYTITVKNTGNIAGTANVQDTKLKELIDNGILKVDEESREIANKLMEGTTVDVLENAEATISFKAEVLKVDGNITNIAVVGEEKPEVIIDTANIEIKKDVKEIIRNGEKVEGPVKVNDVINYEIVVSNTGSATAKVNVIDEIQNSNKKLDLKDENGKVVTEITVEGKSQRILTATYTVMQEDINKQEEILNVAKAIYDGDEKKDDAKTLVEEEKKDVIVEKLVTGKTKNVNLKAVKKDDVLVYSVKVTNNGNTTIDKVTITDEMLGIENKEYTFKAINPGESTIIELGEYTVKQEDINAQNPIKNVVLVNGKQDEKDTPVEKEVKDVIVEKLVAGKTESVDLTAVKKNDVLVYSVKVTNNGNTTIDKVTITDEMLGIKDKEYTFEAINPGESTIIELGEYTVKQEDINAQNPIKNVVLVNGKQDEKDTPVEKEVKDVIVEKLVAGKTESVDLTAVKKNDVLVYSVKVTNNGNTTIDKVTITDEMLGIKDKEYTFKAINPGESTIIELGEYTVTQEDINAQKAIKNIVLVNGKQDEKDTPVEKEVKDVIVEKLVAGKTESVNLTAVKKNDVLVYSVKVTNNGNTTIDKVTITDEMLGIENKEYTFKAINPGESTIIELGEYTVTQEDINAQNPIKNVVLVNGKQDEKDTPVEKEVKDVIVEKLVAGKTESVDLTAVKKNDVLVYSVKVTNNGNTTISKVTITDEMLGIENKEYTFKAINPGESTIIELGEYTVTQEDINAQKAIKNVVLVNDKQDDVETPVETATPKVEIEKTISAITVNGSTTTFDEGTLISGIKVQIGDIVTYKIEAINNGNATLSNVKITDNKDVVLVSAKLPERLSNVTIATGNKITKNNNLLGTNNITLEPGEKITLTVSYTMLKSDVTGTNYQKDFVNTAYVTGEFNKTKYDDNDDATIQTEFIPSTGSKTFVKVWDDKNYESCRPKTITIQLMNGTIKVQDEITISATENWSYTWNNIPLEDTSGNMISYTVVEKEIPGYTASACTTNSKGQLTITNSYKKPVSKEGQIIKTINKETSTEIKVPIDVVFIVDTSGSMETNSRAASMVNAVNSAATQILNYNEYNRISVVGYSGTWNDGKNTTDSTVLLPLDRYTAKKSSNNINQYLKINGNTISTNVTGKVNNTRYVDGGTYTQIGIKDGANQLISSTNKTVTINGKEVKRTPVIILLSDGEPTLYTSNYNNVTSQNRMGGGDFASAEMGYYTILSANYYKNQVSTTYGKTAKMYTIGMDMSGIYGKSVLNPTINNITNLCKNSTEVDEYGYNAAKNLYNCFANSKCGFGSVEAVWNEWEWKWEYRLNMKEQNVTKNPYSNYSYADDSYVGAMNAQQLEDTMKDIITDVIPNTETWAISTSEIDSAKALLPGLDINGAFSFKVGTAINYTNCSEAIAAGIIAGNEEEGYYIDLTKVPAGSTITVSYTAK